ncbi:MAG: TetR/AcrR family transcriptional regulator [Gemmatimonadetes bacterium]|nr:TetR/AcrR family transcriptional regulator [Gemmatimonadota bacterium]
MGTATVDRLLAVGRRLFAEGGFDGTSIRSLTAEAGANLGAVTYHFDTKEGLYQAVLASVFGPVREGIVKLARSPLPASDRLELFVRVMFHHQKEHQDLPRFMAQEIVLGEHPSQEVLETVKTVVGALSRIMEDGQEEGTLVEGDPVLLALSLLSQPIYLSLMPRFLSREDLRDAELPRPRESAESHVIALLRRAFFVRKEESE